jgi:phosphomannomutase
MAGRQTLRESLSYRPVELAFGTSGLRGLVADITPLETYVNTRGFLRFLLESGEIRPGATVCVAGDLRPSTETILPTVLRAVRDAGLSGLSLGRIPSPALLYAAARRGAASVMVTGSHIPFDRNGIKFNRTRGEVLKADEEPILRAVRCVRDEEYGRPAAQSIFDIRGELKAPHRVTVPDPAPGAEREYIERYLSAFPAGALAGKRILVWQHSAVGRDILLEILRGLGADAVPAGRSGSFVAVDTEAVSPSMIEGIRRLAEEAGGRFDAAVSTDGDSDRPLLLAVGVGGLRFFPGDLLGAAAADFLGVRSAAVPVSANDALDLHFARTGVRLTRTRIGSPHVIAAMEEAGWEANGGFLTARPLTVPGGGVLEPLPTRDAVLPLLAVLCASLGRGRPVAELLDAMPRRFGCSSLVRGFPRSTAQAVMARACPVSGGVEEARFGNGAVTVVSGGEPRRLPAGDPLERELRDARAWLSRFFDPASGFLSIERINWLDGARITFAGGDVAHIRPSGNAPEMRIYANAGTQERAAAIAEAAAAEGGIIRRMAAVAAGEEAVVVMGAHPGPIRLHGTVQHYEWGGRAFIPALIGRENPAGESYAELWMGAHPKAPAVAELPAGGEALRVPLDALVASSPAAVLGEAVARRFGGKLPYLFKVLDARTMLSLQAHPDKAQAEAGFARETAAGVPLTAPGRTYLDDNHKPEVHCALGDFWMLHGFRALPDMSRTLAAVPELRGLSAALPAGGAAPGPAAERDALRALYRRVMTMPQEDVDALLAPLVARLERERPGDRDRPDYWALRAAREHPLPGGHLDRGIVSVYLLNLVHLRAGEGTFQPAGTLHAYLEGVNVELMASSDNVLRGGLTPKHVDAEGLLSTLSFESGPPRILSGEPLSPVERAYPAPVEEFLLTRIEAAPGKPRTRGTGHSADTLIVIEGRAVIRSAGGSLPLERGGIALVPAGVAYTVEADGGRAVLFAAAVPGGGAQ